MAEAIATTERFLAAGSGVLAQQWACGRREGVTLFIKDGSVLANCGHVAYRTTPPLGGASVMRQSIRVPGDVLEAAVRLVKAVGLQGVCEVEFRRDANNHPLLMEINPRLAGTIENAIQSGVDFPLMIWQWATGADVQSSRGHRTGVRTRWLQGDLRWLRENLGRPVAPTASRRDQSFWIFAWEFAEPGIMTSLTCATRARPSWSCVPLPSSGGRFFRPRRREHHVTTREVLVIGAGPFGLSISAHLRGLGVDHMIVGRPGHVALAHARWGCA